MRILWHECKKILNPRLILVAFLFTWFFYNVFIGATRYPNDSAESVAELQLSQRLIKEGTTLPLSEFYRLDKIREENLKKLDQLVVENEVLKAEGITTYEQAREMRTELDANGKSDVVDEIETIIFQTGRDESFMIQEIDYIYEESLGEFHFLGATEKEAAESVREHYSQRTYSKVFLNRMEKMFTMEEMSLLPASALNLINYEFVRVGILMMLCCIIIILPNQIREKISKVRGLQNSTDCGRNIWKMQLGATILVSLLICFVQLGIYFAVLWKVGILDFIKCPVNACKHHYIWFDIDWGTYLVLYSILLVIYVTAVMAVFYLISRLASNYVIGVAVAIVPAILFSMFCSRGLRSFLVMIESQKTIYMPIGITIGVVLVTVIVNILVCKWDHRRDILE